MISDLLDRHRSLRILLSLIILVVAIYLFQLIWSFVTLFADIILLFFLAWIVSFILAPISEFLQRRHVPRVLAVALIYLSLAVIISGLIVLTIPVIGGQMQRLALEVSAAFSPANLNLLASNVFVTLRRMGLSNSDAHKFVSQITAQLPNDATILAQTGLNLATQLVTSILTILADTFLVIILSFYMMLDGDRLIESLVLRLPPSWRPDIRLFQRNVDQIFGGFFRAQLIIGLVYALFTWVTLMALGQANGLLVALLAGILMLLPLIGPYLAVIPPVVLVLLQTPSDQVALKVIILLIVLIAAQQIALQVLAPRIFSATMGVPPLILFAALLVGAKIGGVWGAFFAAPIVSVAFATIDVFYSRFQANSPLFRPPPSPSTPSSEPSEASSASEDTTGSSGLALIAPTRQSLDGAEPAEAQETPHTTEPASASQPRRAPSASAPSSQRARLASAPTNSSGKRAGSAGADHSTPLNGDGPATRRNSGKK